MSLRKLSWIALMVLIAGCAGTNEMDLPINPQANSCHVVEARPSSLSTVPFVVCWDSAGHPVGMVGGAGTSQASAAENAL